MKLSIYTVLSIAAAAIAAPTVDLIPRNGSPAGCQQGTQLTCCQQAPTPVSANNLAGLQGATGGILGAVATLAGALAGGLTVLPLVQCFAAIGQVEFCPSNTLCCYQSTSGSTANGLVNAANGASICIAPQIA